MKRFMLICLVAFTALCMSCGEDDNNGATNNGGTNNGGTNNGGTNNGGTNNGGTNNGGTNNGGTNNGGTNNGGLEEPYIASFTWLQRGTACSIGGSECSYVVNVNSKRISNQDGRTVQMSDADLQTFNDVVQTADVISMMRDGWDCPDVNTDPDMGMTDMGTDMGSGDMGTGDMGADAGGGDTGGDTGSSGQEIKHLFHANIIDGSLQEETQDVTGCVLTDSAKTQPITETIDDLVAKYLP